MVLNKLKSDKKGQALVEFALVLPILLVVVLGIVQFGVILNGYVSITHAAREGARMAAVGGGDEDDIKNRVVSATKTTGFIDVSKDNIQISYIPPRFKDEEETEPEEPHVGDQVQIVIEGVEVNVIVPLISSIIGNSVPIASSASMRLEEGYRLAVTSPQTVAMKIDNISGHTIKPNISNPKDLEIDIIARRTDNDQTIEGVFVNTSGLVGIREFDAAEGSWVALPEDPPGNKTLETNSSGNVTLVFKDFFPTTANEFELIIKEMGLSKTGYYYEAGADDNVVYYFNLNE